ncbi:unnamed protein product [Durusdinium trenchii]
MCLQFTRGNCRSNNCRFAHSVEELRAPPDLAKTAMCRAFARGACRATNCKFAHAEEELRVSPTVYKTQLCHFFARGHCKKGDRCRHAHGPKELRPFESSLPTAGARAESFREDGGEPSPRTPQKVRRRSTETPTPSTCSPSPMKVQLPQLRTLCNLGESPLKEVLELLRTHRNEPAGTPGGKKLAQRWIL